VGGGGAAIEFELALNDVAVVLGRDACKSFMCNILPADLHCSSDHRDS
jgi:hypothetical protein